MKHDQSGFTLIEVLVAVAIVATMLGTVGTALRLMSDASGRGSRDVDRLDMVSRGLAAVRQDIARIERVVAVDRKGVRFAFEGERNQMSFVVVEPGYPSDPGSYTVTYSVRKYGGGAQLVRARDIYDPGRRARRGVRDDAAEVVVLEGPYRFELSYLTQAGPRQQWSPRWNEPLRMPLLIRLEMTSTDPRVPSLPPLVTRLRVDAEATCLAGANRTCTPRTGQLTGDGAGAKSQPRGEAFPR